MDRPDEDNNDKLNVDWVYTFRRKLILSILGILTVTLILTMSVIAIKLKEALVEDSLAQSNELGKVVHSSLKNMMIARDPAFLQMSLEEIGNNNTMLNKACILDINGTVVYSSKKEDIGKVFDKNSERSCTACHDSDGTPLDQKHIVTTVDGVSVQRNVIPIYNEKTCHACHPSTQRIIGKLLIDRPMKPINDLISAVELTIAASGIIALVLLVPLMSRVMGRGLNRYIDKIVLHTDELKTLYLLVERLSKTLNLKELKLIVVDILGSTLEADEIFIMTPREDGGGVGGGGFSSERWNPDTGKLTRTMVDPEELHYAAVKKWLKGELRAERIAEDGKGVYMPIIKSGHDLALIVLRNTEARFDPSALGLVRTMGRHIAIAFENARLYNIAITDELTGLFTLRHFRTKIDDIFTDYEAYGDKFAFIMADLDDFKAVNDTHGHEVGNLVLAEFGRLLMGAIRNDDMAFRYGGEEFAVVLPSTGTKGGMQVAERIRESVQRHVFDKGGLDISLTISAGVSVCPKDAENAKDLITIADKALYAAKHSGKNLVVPSGES